MQKNDFHVFFMGQRYGFSSTLPKLFVIFFEMEVIKTGRPSRGDLQYIQFAIHYLRVHKDN